MCDGLASISYALRDQSVFMGKPFQEICNGAAYHFRPLLGRGHTGHRLFSYAYSEGPCQIFEEFDTGPPTILQAI